MIAPLPPDPTLPTLGAALDGDIVRAALLAHLPDCADGTFTIASCRPDYIRYKPGTSCLIRYALTLRDTSQPGAAAVETLAHLRLYEDAARAAQGAAKDSLQRLVARAARHHPQPPLHRVAHLPQLHACAQLYPVDHDLRSLVHAAAPGKMRAVLRDALPAGMGQGLAACRPTLVRYKPGRKAMLRYELTGEGGAIDTVYGKVYADNRGPDLFAACRDLARLGIPTPDPLAYLPDLRMLVHPQAAGRPLASLQGCAELRDWMRPVAETLDRLHAAPPLALRRHTLGDEAAILINAGRAVGGLLPALAAPVARLAARLADAICSVGHESAIVHGDFYADQVLVSDAGVALLDFDEVRLGHPLLDAGNLLAHLSARAREDALPAEEAHGSFRDAWLASHPVARNQLALFEAAALLKLAVGPFRRLEPDWPERVEWLVRLAEARLCGYPHRSSTVPETPPDPRLPQLDDLCDPALMADELARAVYREPVAIERIAIERHKRGRRCLLRYELRIGSPDAARRARLYGKTFASERGPRVHAVAKLIAAARACGPEVHLPDPVGYLPHLKLLLQREVPGGPIASALLGGDTALAERVADALHALHASGLDLGRRHDLDKELDPLRERTARLGEGCPALAAQATRCLALVETGRWKLRGWRWRPIHRDFYHEQILVGDAGLAVLDFDDAALAEPAIDVANFLAHLTLLSLQHQTAPARLRPVASAFVTRYRRHDAGLEPASLRFFEGATLLRLAEIHLRRDRGAWVARQLLDRGERLLTAVDRS